MPHPGLVFAVAYVLYIVLMFTTGHLWNMENVNYILLGVFALGAYCIYYGIYKTKQRRQTENIPTSKIATGAVGSEVEIHGKVVLDEAAALTAPLTGTRCAWYSLQARLDDKRFIDQHSSPFYVDDGSGALAKVNPKKAKFKPIGERNTVCITAETLNTRLEEYPEFKKFLETNPTLLKMAGKLNRSELLHGKAKIEITEYTLTSGPNVYVLGHAQSALKKRWKPRLSLKNFLKAKKEIEGDKALASRFDTNRDGKLDPNELEEGARTLGLQYEGESERVTKRRRLDEKVKMVFEHSSTHPLTVHMSKRDVEAEMVQGIQEEVKYYIQAGAVLCILPVAFIFYLLIVR